MIGRDVFRLLRIGREIVEFHAGAVGIHEQLPVALAHRDVRRAIPGNARIVERLVISAIFPKEWLRSCRDRLAQKRGRAILAIDFAAAESMALSFIGRCLSKTDRRSAR